LPNLDTLVPDIQALFEKGHECDPEQVKYLGEAIANVVAKRLKEGGEPPRQFKQYLSQIGKPDRQVWYDAHSKGVPEKLDASARTKFLFGDILEELLLFLAVEAGHTVEDEQKRVVIEGVSGRQDAKIDGVTVDVKSASKFAFAKFKDGSLRHKDDFGYMWQLASYSHAEGGNDGAFFAINKELGHICVMPVPKEELKLYDVVERINEQKAVIASDVPPERCYDDIPEGKSGNMRLCAACSYCKHKEECWPGLRTFIYSTGPKFLTKVVREPDVPEVKPEQVLEELNEQ
jgi:hypothetical protein